MELLTKPLCKIINLPLSSKFPLMRNTAKVKSLYEKGKTTEPTVNIMKDYRQSCIYPAQRPFRKT